MIRDTAIKAIGSLQLIDLVNVGVFLELLVPLSSSYEQLTYLDSYRIVNGVEIILTCLTWLTWGILDFLVEFSH